jgi:predicted DsbA family dithiol-disulfide isomerase
VLHEALFAAYFERGADIGDGEVLCEIARDAGVDDQGLRQALADETYASRVDGITAQAREQEILSTPTFIFPGGFRLIGGQEYAVFASVTRRLMERIASGAIEVS